MFRFACLVAHAVHSLQMERTESNRNPLRDIPHHLHLPPASVRDVWLVTAYTGARTLGESRPGTFGGRKRRAYATTIRCAVNQPIARNGSDVASVRTVHFLAVDPANNAHPSGYTPCRPKPEAAFRFSYTETSFLLLTPSVCVKSKSAPQYSASPASAAGRKAPSFAAPRARPGTVHPPTSSHTSSSRCCGIQAVEIMALLRVSALAFPRDSSTGLHSTSMLPRHCRFKLFNDLAGSSG